MPRYCCLLDERALASFRGETRNAGAICNVPSRYIEWRDPVPGAPPPANAVPEGMTPVHRFDADDRIQADRYFRRMQRDGCPMRWEVVGDAGTDLVAGARPWRFRDGFHHARERMRVAPVPANAEGLVRANPCYKSIGSLLGQVNEMYHGRRKEDGVAILTPQDRNGVAHSLRVCEEALATLALMVSAGIEMIDPAYPALGLDNRRRFRIVIDDPEPPPTTPADEQTNPTTRRPRPATVAK